MTLAEFLLARIAEREAVALLARGSGAGEWASWNRSWDASNRRSLAADGVRIAVLPMTIDEHVCLNDPAHVLAWCETVRQIVEMHAPTVWTDEGEPIGDSGTDTWWEVLHLLALPHADHPDFDPAWRV